MPFLYEVREKHQEERYDKQAYVHAIDIRICGDNHLVVSKPVDTVFYIERCLKKVELIVFVYHFLCHSERIERLAPEREYGLGLSVSHFGDGAGCGVSLSDED